MAITLRRETVTGYLKYEDIWTRIQNLCDDTDSDVLTVIKEVINLVYDEIMARYHSGQFPPQWLCDYDDALSTAADTRTTVLASSNKDVERILTVSIQDNNTWRPCTPITITEIEQNPDVWWSTTNTQRPYRYLHQKDYNQTGDEDNNILWFPLPDAVYPFRYWFEKRIAPMVNADDVPQLPKWGHPALVYGPLVQLAMFDIRVKVGPWSELYDRILMRLDNFSNNFVLNTEGVKAWGA